MVTRTLSPPFRYPTLPFSRHNSVILSISSSPLHFSLFSTPLTFFLSPSCHLFLFLSCHLSAILRLLLLSLCFFNFLFFSLVSLSSTYCRFPSLCHYILKCLTFLWIYIFRPLCFLRLTTLAFVSSFPYIYLYSSFANVLLSPVQYNYLSGPFYLPFSSLGLIYLYTLRLPIIWVSSSLLLIIPL